MMLGCADVNELDRSSAHNHTRPIVLAPDEQKRLETASRLVTPLYRFAGTGGVESTVIRRQDELTTLIDQLEKTPSTSGTQPGLARILGEVEIRFGDEVLVLLCYGEKSNSIVVTLGALLNNRELTFHIQREMPEVIDASLAYYFFAAVVDVSLVDQVVLKQGKREVTRLEL